MHLQLESAIYKLISTDYWNQLEFDSSNFKKFINNLDCSINLNIKPINKDSILKKLQRNPDYYSKPKYLFGLDEVELSKENIEHNNPQNELQTIEFEYNNKNKSFYLGEKYFCFSVLKNYKIYQDLLNNIFIEIRGGAGAGSYYGLFIFNQHGEILREMIKYTSP